jgi:hypothetical protein
VSSLRSVPRPYISDNEAAEWQSSAEELELARDAIRVVAVVAELSSELDERESPDERLSCCELQSVYAVIECTVLGSNKPRLPIQTPSIVT